MRLKTIPEGALYIKFINPHQRDLIIHWNKQPFLGIMANSFVIIDCASFFCELPPLPYFPEFNLYANLKPIINVIYTEVMYANNAS